MPLLVYGIGFAICYFIFDLSWWLSLLIAFAAPAALGLATMVIGIPLASIEALVEKIRERRQGSHPQTTWENAYDVTEEQQEIEMPLIARAENFVVHSLDNGIHTRAGLTTRGKALGYSEATIGKALNNLLEAGEIERIARGVYSKVSSIAKEKLMPEKATQPEIGDAEEIATLMLEIEKQRKKQSNTFGIWSLVLGVIGIFTFYVPVAAVAAIVLGALQFRRHRTKLSIAGFTLGIISVVLFVIVIKLLSYEVPIYPMTI